LAAIDFTYSDPEPRFDRSKVKGLVATLIDLEQKNFKSSTALEICAGGKLYNVVVEDEKVGSLLLERGKLRKRVTIIPLNKINAFKLSADVSLSPSMKKGGLIRSSVYLLPSKLLPAKSISPLTLLEAMRTFLPPWLTCLATLSSVPISKQPKR
jgi:hypothetical protein